MLYTTKCFKPDRAYVDLVVVLIFLLCRSASANSGPNSDCVGIHALRPQCSSPEVPYKRDFFYVNWRYVYNETLKGSLTYDQMYVEKLTPPDGYARKPYPIVLFSAGIPSGAVWLNTPDNRRGWASYFISQGNHVYIVDEVSVGRSSQLSSAGYPQRIASTDVITQDDFTAPELIDPYPQSHLHTQWPGNGTRGDPVFDAFEAAFIPLTANTTHLELAIREASCKLLELIGPSFTICHSIGCTYPILISDECPHLLRGSINLEPGNIPFQSYYGNATVPAVGRTKSRPWGLTESPVHYDPPIANPSELKLVTAGEDTPGKRSCIFQASDDPHSPPHTLPRIADVPYVALTGEASPHTTYENCTVEYLKQVGVRSVEWIHLEDEGIYGNGHFFFVEKNNLYSARVVGRWIERHS